MKCPACECPLHEAPPLECSAAPVHRAAAIELGRYALLVATVEGELQAARMAAHRLPVLVSCGQCHDCDPPSYDTKPDDRAAYCVHPGASAPSDNPATRVDRNATPPEWCPMRVKP